MILLCVAPSIAVDSYQVTILLLCGTVYCGRDLPRYNTVVLGAL